MLGVAAACLAALLYFGLTFESEDALVARARDAFGAIKHEPLARGSEAFRQMELGRKLFFDPGISRNGSMSCASCHRPGLYGADPVRNTPSNFNLRYQHFFHWRVEHASVEEQAERAFTHPGMLAHANEREAAKRLTAAGYKGLGVKAAAAALAEYQRSLVTPAPFDRFLEGDRDALTKEQRAGFRKFMTLGCVSCHNGPAIGGRDFQKFGPTQNYWEVTGSRIHDRGRMDVTMSESDRNVFKVPSLRNVARTAPYFHDGSASDLPTAIRWMMILQLGMEPAAGDVRKLERFLESLTGELPER